MYVLATNVLATDVSKTKLSFNFLNTFSFSHLISGGGQGEENPGAMEAGGLREMGEE